MWLRHNLCPFGFVVSWLWWVDPISIRDGDYKLSQNLMKYGNNFSVNPVCQTHQYRSLSRRMSPLGPRKDRVNLAPSLQQLTFTFPLVKIHQVSFFPAELELSLLNSSRKKRSQVLVTLS